MNLFIGPHAAFIAGSYAIAALIVGGLTAAIILDYRARLRELARLEERGARRRSQGGSP